jgi:hypothetical protein
MPTWNIWGYYIPVWILLYKWLWKHQCFRGMIYHYRVTVVHIMSCLFLQWHGTWNTPSHCNKAMMVAHVNWLYFNKFILTQYCFTEHGHMDLWGIRCKAWQWVIQKAPVSRNLEAHYIAHFHQQASVLWVQLLKSEILLASCVCVCVFFRLYTHRINISGNEKMEEKVQEGKQHNLPIDKLNG